MRTLLYIIFSLLVLSAFAQSSASDHKLGVKTSFNLSLLLGDELQNPRPKFGYTAGAYCQFNHEKKWSIYTEFTGSFRGSKFNNGDTGYSKIALFYLDVAAMPTYKIDDKRRIAVGPYASYLGLSSVFKGEQKKAYLNDIGIGPLDAGVGAYYTIQGPIVGFQIGSKIGLANANKDVNFVELSPTTGNGGFIRNFSLEIGMIF